MPFDLDEQFVKVAESKLGCRLPMSYRQAMMKCNGGKVVIDGDSWWLNSIFDSSDRKRISRTCNDIVRETERMRDRFGLPDNAIAICVSNLYFGETVIFLRNGEVCKPEIFRWRHATGELVLLAKDFSEVEHIT